MMNHSGKQIALVAYSQTEERLHVITHTAGLAISALIVWRCLMPAIAQRDPLRIVCAALYLFGTTIMFLTSALYHGAKPSDRKRTLRLLDHCMIFFAVAGTATACVPPVYETAGHLPAVLMGGFAWLGAISGLFLTLFSFEKTKALQMALYIGTAGACALSCAKAFTILPRGAFCYFLGGSVTLLVGAVLYGVGKKVRYFHAVFHVLILIGLSIYYLGIQTYCFPD